MPEETGPLLKRVGNVTQSKAGRFPIYSFRAGEAEVMLIRSGMGEKNAAEATEALIAFASPDLIVSFGFGGAVLAGTEVGDIIAGSATTRLAGGALSPSLLLSPLPILAPDWKTGAIITTREIVQKREMALRLPPGMENPVLDMETFVEAEVAGRHGIQFYGLRCISDDAREELGFGIDEFCDKDLNLRIWRVMWTVARKPLVIPQLARLARNSRLAGERLADALMTMLARIS